jgi:hypothetical protein
MASREVEIFQTSYKKLQEIWRAKVERPLKDLEFIQQELEEFDEKETITDEDKKAIKEVFARQDKYKKAVEAANFELKKDLSYLDPPAKVTKDEMNELLKWMKKSFEKIKMGLPIADKFNIEPEAEVDWKKLKFKSLGINLKWKF